MTNCAHFLSGPTLRKKRLTTSNGVAILVGIKGEQKLNIKVKIKEKLTKKNQTFLTMEYYANNLNW